MIKKTILFLVLNFSALAIGGLFTGPGVSSSWYQVLNQAPWTPPGWVFGFAWTLIMLCFSFYMAYLISSKENRKTIIALFAIQWVLNIAWNPIFFYYRQVALGLICISALTILVAYFFFKFRTTLRLKTLLVAPYFIWLLIASSLNAYILFYN